MEVCVKKYKVTYSLYGFGQDFAQYAVEFLANPNFTYEVAESLRPADGVGVSWMIYSIKEVI